MESDLPRSLKASGEEFGEFEGDGVVLFKEFARSAIDGDLEPRTLPFLTEKKAGEGPGVGPVDVEVGVAPGATLDSFSSALIL